MNTYKSEQDLINEIVDMIDKFRVEKNFSIYELANRSDISANTIKYIYKRKSLPNIRTIYNICNGFEIPVWFFFYKIDGDSFSSNDDSIMIENYKKLSKRSKELLVELSKNLK